jgi:Na+-driven multidrug efflux pump
LIDPALRAPGTQERCDDICHPFRATSTRDFGRRRMELAAEDRVSLRDLGGILVRFLYYLASTVSQAVSYGVVTAVVAKSLGLEGLTAYAIATTILLYISYMFLFPVSGRISAIAEAMAMGDNRLAGRRILFSFFTATVVGLLVGLVLFLVEKPFVGFFTSNDSIKEIVYPFYGIHCAIIPLNMITVVIVGVSLPS